MSLLPVAANGKVALNTVAPAAGDNYQGGLLIAPDGSIRAAIGNPNSIQVTQGFGFTNSGQLCYTDSSAGLPANTTWVNGLPFNPQGALCTSSNAIASVSGGVPFDANGAVCIGGGADPVVTTYVAAVVAAGGTIPGGQQSALNTFVTAMKSAGLWTRTQELGVFAGGTVAGAAVKLKTAGPANCTMNGFVLGDISSIGITSDGSTKWVDTGTTITQLSPAGANQGALGMGVFLTAECTTATPGYLMGTDAGSAPQVGLRWNVTAVGSMDLLIQGGGVPQWNKPRGKLPIGLISGHRNGATAIFGYEGGTNISGGNAGFTYQASANQIAVCSGFFGNNKVAMSCGLYYISDGTWTDADVLTFTQLVNALMVGMGRVVPDARSYKFIPIIGQSLASGSQGNPPLSTSQAYKNLTQGSGLQANMSASPPTAFWNGGGAGNGYQVGDITPMVEIFNETIASGASNTISQKARANSLGSIHDTLSMNFSLGATAYAGLAKGTNPYANAMASIGVAPVQGILFATGAMNIPALFCVHGESDMANGSYDLNIRQWQSDYQTDIKAITGQGGVIPIFHSQPSCWTDPVNTNSATGISPYLIMAESRANPTLTLCVCPKYFLTYSANAGQQIHLINTNYRLLGEYYGKAYYQHVIQGTQWIPLRFKTVSRAGAVITLTLEGNVGNLVLDTTTVTDPSGGLNTKGFEYVDSSSPSNYYSNISSVALSLPNQIIITLAFDPSANTGRTLRYAYIGTVGNHPGPTTGPRGNVKDSDATTGVNGDVLVNWLCHDTIAVP
jgi:hypothetical protein